jgi:hypothetical protein
MTTLKEAREKGKLAEFIAEREAEGQAPGDAKKTDALIRRIAETPTVSPRAWKRAARDG